MRFIRLHFFCLLLLLFIHHVNGFAQEAIILNTNTKEIRIGKSLYYLKDTDQEFTFDQIRSQEFDKKFIRSTHSAPNFGNVKTVWNKFKLSNLSAKKWFLTVENYNIDTLTFYYPDTAGTYHKIVMGSAKAYSDRIYKVNPYILDLPVPVNNSAVFYLKVETYVFQYPLSVISEERLLEKNQSANIGLGIYFGFLILIIFFSSVAFAAFKDRGYLYYILYVLFTGLMIFDREGLIAATWDHLFWAKASLFIALASASIFPFTCYFLETKKNSPVLHSIINYILLPGTFLAPLFDMLGHKYAASLCNQLFGLLGLIFLYGTAWYIYRKGFKHIRFYIIASTCYFIGIVVFILKTNAILPHNSLTNSALEIGSVLEMILFSFSLGDKLNIIRKKRETAENSLQVVRLEKLSAEKSKEFKEQFLANMSHEIRTPMNAILGMTNLTLSTPINSKQKDYLTAIKKSSENLLVIINDILDLSKLEAGKMQLDKISFRLQDLIQQVYYSMQFKAEEKCLQLIIKINPDVPPVIKADSSRLSQVLINLIGNAIKFTSKGSVSVTIELDKNNNKIQFRIADTGIGIAQDKISSLFQNFAQADSSTSRKFGGTGLGLSISKTLIELHGGKIEIKSTEGKGSEFYFSIPLEIGNESEIESDGNQVIDAASLRGIKILVAEDNEYNQIVIQDTLKNLIEDVTIEIAPNGKIAIEKLANAHFDILLMDMNMPEMGGIEATQYIRSQMKHDKKTIPILALTANVMEKDMTKILASGMNDCIPKPFTQEELLNGLLKYYKNKKAVPSEKKEIINESPVKKVAESQTSSDQQVTDLTFLGSFCDDDRIRMKKYIDMYLNGINDNLKKVWDSHSTQDYASLSRIAHTIKPHFNYMGMNEAKKVSETIENYAGESRNLEQLPALISQLNELCKKSVEELGKFK
jgi:signal transduction histidine kinase/CheY-like chemotaxis protein